MEYLILIPVYLWLSRAIDKLNIHWTSKWLLYMFSIYAGINVIALFTSIL